MTGRHFDKLSDRKLSDRYVRGSAIPVAELVEAPGWYYQTIVDKSVEPRLVWFDRLTNQSNHQNGYPTPKWMEYPSFRIQSEGPRQFFVSKEGS